MQRHFFPRSIDNIPVQVFGAILKVSFVDDVANFLPLSRSGLVAIDKENSPSKSTRSFRKAFLCIVKITLSLGDCRISIELSLSRSSLGL